MAKDVRPNIPDFGKPPVHEVVIACFFQELPRICGPELGSFWREALASSYPRVTEVQSIAMDVERFDPPKPKAMKFQVETRPKLRTWFMDQDEDFLIQIQRDFFARNWRLQSGKVPYPRYETLRSDFVRDFGKFDSYITKNSLGKLILRQCEVTYVNHIFPATDVWERLGQVNRILNGISGAWSADHLPGEPEQVQLQTSFRIVLDGEPVGRLRLYLEPQFLARDNTPLYRLILQARGKPLGDGLGGLLKFVDIGRDWIVKAFAAVTTSDMHKVWERTDVGDSGNNA